MEPSEIVSSLIPYVPQALIATDFDGTLASLEEDPEEVRLADGAFEAIAALAAQGAQIAVITGRDVETLLRLSGLSEIPRLLVAGVYGIETWSDGKLLSPDTPESIRDLRRLLPDALEDGDPDIWVEDKRLSVVIHARRAQDPPSALAAVSEEVHELGDDLGLEVHPGSSVLELRVPGFNKASALDRLSTSARAVLYIGDDTGDFPAFHQIRSIRANGKEAWGIGVLSSGTQGVAEVADATLANPNAVVEFLRALGSGTTRD